MLADSDVVAAVLVLATVPLLVGGAVVAAIRDRTSSVVGLSRRTLEWAVLVSGIVVVYTGVVVGLGTLVGGSGPTWFLVAATGLIAVVLEPIRHARPPARRPPRLRGPRRSAGGRAADRRPTRCRRRRRPAAATSSSTSTTSCASTPWPSTSGSRTVGNGPPSLGTVDDPPSSRPADPSRRGRRASRAGLGATGRRCATATSGSSAELAGPLSLAVGWVRLADDLRRSSVAIVSAREEERRRLRRDLHDGLGPSLTGVSLGLRTAVRQLGRADDGDGAGPGPRPALSASPTRSTPSSSSSSGSSATCARPPSTSSACVGAVAEFTRRSATPSRSTWRSRPSRSSCRRPSRWRPTASSPRPSPTSCATPGRRAAG